MSSCDNQRAISAYHDGELPPEKAQVLEAHLRECPECRRELARLQAITGWLSAAPVPEMPAGAMRRLGRGATVARDRVVMRTAGALTAAAAAVLICCSAMLVRQRAPAAPAPPIAWDSIAVMAAPQVAEVVEEDADIRLARSILGSASSEGGYANE